MHCPANVLRASHNNQDDGAMLHNDTVSCFTTRSEVLKRVSCYTRIGPFTDPCLLPGLQAVHAVKCCSCAHRADTHTVPTASCAAESSLQQYKQLLAYVGTIFNM